jgi:predicted permease
LIRKTFVESLTVSLLGATAGIAIAYAATALILHLALAQPDMWAPVSASPSVPALLFALGISVITGIAFGSAPAWMTSRARPIEALRSPSPTVAGNRHPLQKTLVIAQTAISVVLLSAAAMLAQSLRNLEHQNFGFESDRRYLVSINPKLSNYKQEQLATLFHEAEDRLRSLPGVRAVGSVLEAPLSGWVWPHYVWTEGKPAPGPSDDIESGWSRITPGFFDVIGGGRILMGRNISDHDNASTRPAALINESFAKKFFRNENPIGQHFGPTAPKNAGMYEIVGVVSDVDFGHGPQPMYFLPEAQSTKLDDPEAQEREIGSHYLYNIVIWAPGNRADIEPQVRRVLAEVDPDLVVNGVQPYSAVIHGEFAQQNMIASLTWLFGAVGLALAAVGLYGVTACHVAQRTSEIGVRIAMGADCGSVLRIVLRGAFEQVGIGLAVGIPAAIGAGHLISSHLFGVNPWDPLLLATASFALALGALIAALIPARRAAKVDPIVALRYE